MDQRNIYAGTTSGGRRIDGLSVSTGPVGQGLTFVELSEMRARFREILRAPYGEEFQHAAVRSACDVPRLIAEVERIVLRYGNLVAACRAGIGWAAENGEPLRGSPWELVADELPPVPETHPLVDLFRDLAHDRDHEDSGDAGGTVGRDA